MLYLTDIGKECVITEHTFQDVTNLSITILEEFNPLIYLCISHQHLLCVNMSVVWSVGSPVAAVLLQCTGCCQGELHQQPFVQMNQMIWV